MEILMGKALEFGLFLFITLLISILHTKKKESHPFIKRSKEQKKMLHGNPIWIKLVVQYYFFSF